MSRRLAKLRAKAKENWPDDDQQMHQQWTVKVEKAIPGSVKCTKAACPHKKKGCTWMFGPAEMELHLQECKFRPYRCIGSKLKILSCGWQGIHHQIEDHLREDHELGEVFSHYQESWMPFSESKSLGGIKLVNAFSKHFLFYYVSNVSAKMAYFMIIYFGRREDAYQYYYEFDIRSKDEKDLRRIKFVEHCVADCDNLAANMAQEKCVAVSFKMLKHYLHDGKIPFRFIVKKVGKRTSSSRE
ncbi:conserved hypothetical protein [Culex quinquefasciatus]|uniref:E3 ubiquitin-protein ligase n=1 Tax=Culex quinquefasciatus TaxID=7176 RepID=B0W2P9_CULQU|nr:conserved hypothetical protein [Culex quinquefasciatus]|eukprot:XP_001842983.1 conserved hypothetical protein [Culex quinquefasciatus]